VNPHCAKKTNSVHSRSIAHKLWQCLIIVFVTAKLAAPAWAQVIYPFHVPAGDLTSSLNELARQADVEILFVSSLTEHRSAPTVEGTLSVADGLTRLLAGTGLLFRQVDSGTFAVTQDSASRVAEIMTIPEILVVGRRTQDADIRRTENDIQPYQVIGAHETETSHADTVDDLLRTHLPSNAEIMAPAQDPGGQGGSTRSEINLHGLGASQTLVLIDGRRMPSLPTTGDSLLQPDLNGIPLSAIDRIETITSTAGGIYGPGATGGVVNVILKRDYRGGDLNVTYGETTRGDAGRTQIDGHIGFTPDAGQSDVSLSLSRTVTSPLTNGDRSYEQQALVLRSNNDRPIFISSYPLISGIFIGTNVGNLSLKPAYGGAMLGSSFTYLPFGYAGAASDGGALLRANAGQLPQTLSPDLKGSAESLESNPLITSVLINARHHFNDNVEAYVDVIDLVNEGHFDESHPILAGISSDAPTNPFNQGINVGFSLPGFDASVINRTHMSRISSGLILTLPLGWRSDIDYSLGAAGQAKRVHGSTPSEDFYTAVQSGLGVNGGPALNPFGDWRTFLSGLPAYRLPTQESLSLTNHLADLSLRLAGPIAQLPSGPATLSLLAEDRHEEVGASTSTSTNLISDGPQATETPRLRQEVSSIYGELRAPLVPGDSRVPLLRALEAQLAIRYDENKTTLPANFDADAVNAAFVTARQGAVVYTAGLKVQPLRSLMFRTSIATGVLPPAIDQLGTNRDIYEDTDAPDPKRGGRLLGTELPITVLSGGSTSLKPENSRSFSIGAVLQPGGDYGPRLSLDFTQIDKSHEISYEHGDDLDYFLANASAYPGRVVRAPLSAADAALGFTGGIVTQIDTTNLNIGSTVARTLDIGLDYSMTFHSGGRLRIQGAATWQPTFKSRIGPDQPWVDMVNYYDGPLEWRGNAGMEWSKDRISIGTNVQYYGHYRVAYSDAVPNDTAYNALNAVFQGAAWIPSQTYVDLFATYLISLPHDRLLPKEMALRLGVEDIFDTAPPVVAGYQSNQGYSSYGDPRRRRFDVTIASRF
jgi:outer membrane receptor protein involved in Fe transport